MSMVGKTNERGILARSLLMMTMTLSIAAATTAVITTTIGTAQASEARDESRLMRGIWRLKAFYRITHEGERVEWCAGVNGLLNYTKQGILFANINCGPNPADTDPAAKYGYMIHYAANYKYDPATRAIHHEVLNSSKLDMIGTVVIRYLDSVSDSTLNLSVPSDHDSLTHLEWERVEQR